MHTNTQKSMSDTSSLYSTKVYYTEEKCENNNHSRGKKVNKHLSETSLTQ